MYFRGGIRIGSSFWDSVNHTWPFVKVTFERGGLAIAVPFLRSKVYFILYESITEVSCKKGFLSKGIVIEHSTPFIPSYIIFWTGKADTFLQLCKDHKLPVKQPQT